MVECSVPLFGWESSDSTCLNGPRCQKLTTSKQPKNWHIRRRQCVSNAALCSTASFLIAENLVPVNIGRMWLYECGRLQRTAREGLLRVTPAPAVRLVTTSERAFLVIPPSPLGELSVPPFGSSALLWTPPQEVSQWFGVGGWRIQRVWHPDFRCCGKTKTKLGCTPKGIQIYVV